MLFDTENKYAPTADSSNIILNPAAAEEGAVLTTQENKSLKYNILDTLHTIFFLGGKKFVFFFCLCDFGPLFSRKKSEVQMLPSLNQFSQLFFAIIQSVSLLLHILLLDSDLSHLVTFPVLDGLYW